MRDFNMKPFIVAINAISGGGKTTITRKLQEYLSNAKALYFDDRDYDSDSGIDDVRKWSEAGADVNVFNLTRLVDDIERLKKERLDFIILDYPFGHRHKQIGSYIDCSIFIDTPLDIAMARRVIRDYNKETASSIFDDMNNYLERGRNIYLDGIGVGRKDADFIIDGSLGTNEIVEAICERIIAAKNTKE